MNNLLLVFLICCSAIYALAGLPKSEESTCLVMEFEKVAAAIKSCSNIVLANISVPGGRTLKLDLLDNATLTFRGTTTFEHFGWKGPLISVNGNGITVQGEQDSILYGQGELYWDGRGSWGSGKPGFFLVQVTGGSILRNIHILNAPIHSVHINDSHDVTFTDWWIDNSAGALGVALAGHEGHNTDGFGVKYSSNVVIKDSVIYNQDDCVALNSGTNIIVSNLFCYGSHGLSLSVGFSNDSVIENSLTNVVIQDSIIIDAMDGIHIKTHIDAGSGIVKNITYQNIFMAGSYTNGIAVEQNYTNRPGNSSAHGALPLNNIPIQDLRLINIKGTVKNTAIPYYIVCAQGGCLDWEWDDISVSGHVVSQCVNFHPNGIECVDSKV